MREINVETLDDLDIALNVIRHEFNKNGKQQVIVKNSDDTISSRQRGLYWRWVGIMAAENGDTKEDFHTQAKERIFLNIFLADQINHQELCGVVAVMKELRPGVDTGKYKTVREYIISKISHLDATVKNMMDVLRQLEVEAAFLGIVLPPPPGPGLTHEK